MSSVVNKLFILALLLVVAAYFVGLNTEAKTFLAGINSLGLTFTGRNAAGVFAGYPTQPAAA